MSLYGHKQLSEAEEFDQDLIDELVEAFIVDDISRMNSDDIKEFCESEEAKALTEKAVLRKPTLMRLSREDDEKRRIRLACFVLAKSAKDPNYDKMVKYHTLWKKFRLPIFKKYGGKATRLARVAQKKYIMRAQKGEESSSESK